ncbi:hypothetical protein IAR50_007170 [Cryptococcus sp. DSM 104548]
MRLYLTALLLAGFTSASLFGSSSSASSASASSSTSTSSSSTSDEVAFLQTLQYAQIASMSCLITLVNLTTTPLGTCLGLTELADLVSNPSSNSSFSDQLNTYLGTVCQETCSDSDLADAKAMLEDKCDTSNALVGALDSIMENYSSSYRTLACQVTYNGTSDLCFPATLNTSTTANSNTFFDALVAGNATDLAGYQDSVFTQAECTGCMYEMFKAAQYTISSIRGQTVTEAFGNHLKNDCPSSSDSTITTSTSGTTNGTDTSTIDWSDVDDQQIPDSLQVSQSTASASSGACSTRMGIKMGGGESWLDAGGLIMSALVGGAVAGLGVVV